MTDWVDEIEFFPVAELDNDKVADIDTVAVADAVGDTVGIGKHDGDNPPIHDQLLSTPLDRMAEAPIK